MMESMMRAQKTRLVQVVQAGSRQTKAKVVPLQTAQQAKVLQTLQSLFTCCCPAATGASPSFPQPCSPSTPLFLFFISSEGALYVILPYDYPAQRRPLFEHTPVLNDNFEH